MYKPKEHRVKQETLDKLIEWGDLSSVLMPGVALICKHLKKAYEDNDALEKETTFKDEDLEFMLKELFYLEVRLHEEMVKNEEYELVIH